MEADSARADTEETGSLTDDQDSNSSPATGGKSVSSIASSSLADQAELERKGSGISVISSENIRSTSCNEEKSYKKPSTYRPVDCSTRLCKSYEYSACYMCSGPRAPSCNNHSCSVPEPGFQLGQDEAALFRSDSRHYPVLRLPSACAEQGNPSDLLPGMDGVARVTSSTLALPAQFSAAWRLSRKFGMCLSQEGSILDGHLFFGDSPLVFSPLNGGHARDLSRHLTSTATVFERLVKEVCPRTIVELGTFLGASALHMAALALDLGLHTQILCVDDFRGWPGFRQNFRGIQILNGDVMLFYQFMQNVASMNSTDTVVSVPYSTAGALKVLCEWGIYEDLIEVDAAHDFHSAWADINAAYAILRPGGVMFGHDYYTMMDNRGVRSAINLFAKLRNLRVEPFFTGHLELPEELKLTLQEVFFQKYFKSRSLDSCEIG